MLSQDRILSIEDYKNNEAKDSVLSRCRRPAFVYYSSLGIPIFLCIFIVFLIYVPWQQTSFGSGSVIAYHPNERIQEIQSPVSGVISRWHVVEGVQVKENDAIADISDIDPLFLERLEQQRKESINAYEATLQALNTSKKNLDRQKILAEKGLKSQRDYEQARLEYSKLEADLADNRNKLTDIESKLARQSSQQVKAPRDGIIMKIVLPQGSAVVKAGDVLVRLVPQADEKVVEAYLPGIDMPFLYVGRKVSLQFEGWPVVQLSGWPSLAVGVFNGSITFIDPSTTSDGRVRVFIAPDAKYAPWPSETFLRQGNRVKVWVFLETVSLGYEIWRRLNAFPPEFGEYHKIDGVSKKDNIFFKSIVK